MKFTKSIRWRLLLWIALFGALILGGLVFATHHIYFSNRVNALDEELRRRVATLSAAFFPPDAPHHFNDHPPGDHRPGPLPDDFGNGPPPKPDDSGNRPPQDFSTRNRSPDEVERISQTAKQFELQNTNGFYFVIWAGNSAAPWLQSTNQAEKIPSPKLAARDTGTYAHTRGDRREAFHATEHGDCILVGRSLAPDISAARRFAALLALSSCAVLFAGLGGAWWLIGRALQPVEKISAAVRRIANGNLSERINTRETESELGQLASVLNSTFARLETAFAQQKQFTGDAAHELRTPLAVLISEAQTTLAREREREDYRNALAATLETAQQMRALTESLLELSRFDAGQEKLQREKTDLAAVAQDGIKLIRPLALAKNLQIHCHLAPVEITGDAEKLGRAITNLLANAVRYNRDDGSISIATRVENNSAILTVADTGIGISPADLPRVFERFYRADQSRSSDGSGLGLAIAKAIIEAHGGAIEVAGEENVGATFTVRLPI
jgi:heavy metal sensor kinase